MTVTERRIGGFIAPPEAFELNGVMYPLHAWAAAGEPMPDEDKFVHLNGKLGVTHAQELNRQIAWRAFFRHPDVERELIDDVLTYSNCSSS